MQINASHKVGFSILFGIIFLSLIVFYLNKNLSKRKPIYNQEISHKSFVLPLSNSAFPTIMVKYTEGDTVSEPLPMKALKMKVKIIGNLVFTTQEMIFYNPSENVLEGQFYFPLAEGQSVTRFALEINDELREAVVVEKSKGRATYESVIRKGIDPGLLEWTKGNNFKARIFPIPAKGTKKLVVAYTHQLLATAAGFMYYQPMAHYQKIDQFKFKVSIHALDNIPIAMDSNYAKFKFKPYKNSWEADTLIKNYYSNKPIAFQLPLETITNKVYYEQISNTDSIYFYASLAPQKFIKNKTFSKRIGLLWDVSASAIDRNITKEINIISHYLKEINNTEVLVIPFANETFKLETFFIRNGNSDDLQNYLKKSQFDGGTQMGCLKLSNYKVDEFLLFSDGISNFGQQEPAFSKTPINAIVTSTSADYSFLKYLTQKTNGQFINGTIDDQKSIIKQLKFHAYRYQNATIKKGLACEIFPSMPTDFNHSFSFAGKMKGKLGEIELNFGFGGETVTQYKLVIEKKYKVNEGTISKIWAQKQIDELDMFPEKFQDNITALGLHHGIITRNTSLLVLDRIEDYVEHHIIPPPGKLRKEYLIKISEQNLALQNEKQQQIEAVVAMFKERKLWWDKKFDWPKKEKTQPEPSREIQLQINPPQGVTANEEALDSTAVGTTYAWNFGDGNGASGNSVTSNYTTPGTYNLTYENANSINIGSNLNFQTDDELDEPNTGRIELKTWKPDAAYIGPLKKAYKNKVYQTYLKLRPKFKNTPAFFFDASDILISKGLNDEALRVLSNIAEMELENHELLRTLAHRLQQLKKMNLAIGIFKDVLKIRDEEPQSYRDLGLAYADNKQYQLAVDMLCKVVNKSWDGRFPEIEVIVVGEINQIIARSSEKLVLDDFDVRLQKNLKTDIRVVINWDSDNCDMDLWITDPAGEKTYYSNPLSQIGGKLSKDFTGGYGPEEFIIKKAMPGKYLVEVDYFGSNRQTLSGPTTVQATLITHSGSKNEKRKDITIRLKTEKEVIEIGELFF